MNSSASTGHCRRTHEHSPHVLTIGAAESAPYGAMNEFQRLDWSLPTDARAQPARPDDRRRRVGALWSDAAGRDERCIRHGHLLFEEALAGLRVATDLTLRRLRGPARDEVHQPARVDCP